MKKLFSFLTLLFLGGMIASEAWAVDYGLKVAGVQVTSSNAAKITGTGISGIVTYDNATKTLTLNSATIKADINVGIENSGIDGLTILVNGNSKVSSTQNTIYCVKNTTIKSSDFSTLTVTSESDIYCAVWMRDGSTLHIEKIWMIVKGPWALYGDGGDVELWECNVHATATADGHSCVKGFADISTWGVTYTYNGYNYNTTDKRMEDSSGTIVGSHTLRPRISVGRFIWDVRNDATITSSTPGADISSGTITYNATTRTMTLNNVRMSTGSYSCINYYGPYAGGDLSVYVKGYNTLSLGENSGSSGVYAYGNGVEIYGDGEGNSDLTINNTKGVGIMLEKAFRKTLSLRYLRLKVSSETTRSIDGDGVSKLDVNSCAVTAYCGISGFTDLTRTVCYVASGGHFSPELKGFTVDDKTIYKGRVLLVCGYDLVVCGTLVTPSNRTDILGDGQFSYNPTDNILTLTNANVTTNSNCITNSIEDLTIKVVGSASLISTYGNGINSTKSFTLTSDAFENVTVKAEGSGFYAISLNGEGTMTISKVWLSASGPCGIGGNSKYNPQLNLNLCNVNAASTDNGACVDGFTEIITSGVIYDIDGRTYDTNSRQMIYSSTGNAAMTHTMRPRMSMRKFIFDPRSPKTIDKDSPGAGITSGEARYEDYTLTLDNMTQNAGTYVGIRYYGPVTKRDLTIKVKGHNTIKTAGGMSGIQTIDNNVTIVGDGASSSGLTLNNNAQGIYLMGEKTLELKDLTLDVTSTTSRSIFGDGDGTLTITNSTVTANDGISGFKECTMTGCGIVEPVGAWFSPELKGVTANGNAIYEGKVMIDDVFSGMYIAETRVWLSNAADILGDGHISYDWPTKTLTVRDAYLEDLEGMLGRGIDNREIEGLIVRIEGANEIIARNDPICSERSFSITGTGSMTATGNFYGLYFAGTCSECVIDGPTLLLKGKHAIRDYYQTDLTVKGAKTSLLLQPEEGFPAIYALKSLQLLDGLEIVKPEGAYFSPSLRSITLDGENAYCGEVLIAAGNSAGDVNGDNVVNVADIATVIDVMAGTETDPSKCERADTNHDGSVNVADIATVIDIMAANARLQKKDMNGEE